MRGLAAELDVSTGTITHWFATKDHVLAATLEELAARTAPSVALRNGLLIEAARLMDEAQLFIPIAAPVRWNLVSGRVPGFTENPFARHTLVGLADTKISADTP